MFNSNKIEYTNFKNYNALMFGFNNCKLVDIYVRETLIQDRFSFEPAK